LVTTIRSATAADFRRFSGFDVPAEYCIDGKAIGYAAERDGIIVALGLVTWDNFGRAWGWFNKTECLPAVTMHRRALAMLAILREVGEPAIHAFCSASIPGAETWLDRLGFARDEPLTAALEASGNPKKLTVWTKLLADKEASCAI
jgi:hypothetical protein